MVDDTRVLSIQSHVVSGYAGNKSAVFPLQVLGFDVDAINSVQFSNHTGYKHIRGEVLNAQKLDDLIEGLRINSIDKYSHLLTGYIGSASFLESVIKVVQHVKKVNPNLTYVCDPVMGDNGKMYVPPELLPIYRDKIIPLADLITPNQFEAEILTNHKINNVSDVIYTMDWFHDKGVRTVVLSSTDLGSDEELFGAASTVTESGFKRRFKIMIPKIPCNFTGTGDLFAALLLAWIHKTKGDLLVSLENTVASMQKVLKRTYSSSRTPNCASEQASALIELKLVQSLDDIRTPEVLVKASEISL